MDCRAGIVVAGSASTGADLTYYGANVFFASANLAAQPSGSFPYQAEGWANISWSITAGTNPTIAAEGSSIQGYNGALDPTNHPLYGWGHSLISLIFTTDQPYNFTALTPSQNVKGIAIASSGYLPAGTYGITDYTYGASPGHFKVNWKLSPASSPPPALPPSPYTLTFYYQPGSNGQVFGHAFVGLTTPFGVAAYGFYSDATNPFGHGILVKDDSTTWQYSITYPVTAAQFTAVSGLVQQYASSPPLYNGVGNNCMDFASQVANVAGVVIPQSTDIGGAGPSDPRAFGKRLSDIGDGKSYNGGTVSKNPSPSAQSPTALLGDPAAVPVGATPYDYSYAGIEAQGHSDANALASALGFPLDAISLGNFNANSTSGLGVRITGNLDPTDAIISINWGDGSFFDEQAMGFSHLYQPGTYAADLLVVDSGAVHSFAFTVSVSTNAGATIPITVATFAPILTPNPGLLPPDPIPELPEPSTAGSMALVLIPLVAARAWRTTG